MKTQFTIKRLIVGGIVFALGLMTLLTLCIPLLKVSDPLIDKIITQRLLDIKPYESGFTLLDFESSVGMDEEMAIICGIFSLLQLLLSIATMILAVLCIFVFDKALMKKILRSFAISCIVFIGLYMVWGIVFGGLYKYLHIFNDGSWGLYSTTGSGWTAVLYETETFTLAYIGFIIGALLFISYIVCSLVLKDDIGQKEKCGKTNNVVIEATKTESAAQNRQFNNLTQANNIAEALKQYKDLLDSGVITQEEFNRKKQEILG